MSDDVPLTEGEDAFLLHFARTAFFDESPVKVGVAVSGGSDSMAVLHLMTRAAAHVGYSLHAVTVDHGLRAEAVDEAQFVARTCAGLGVPHDILLWQHGEITGNLQDQARRARYRLIGDWARGQGITHVVLGHTADDQAETFLMRLARGAGVDGLSAMRRQWDGGGVRFLRPFLVHPRANLRAYLKRNGQDWIEDPTNDDTQFERVKARRALAALKPLGITADVLVGVAVNMQVAQAALQGFACDIAGRICTQDAGDLVFDKDAYDQQATETGWRLLTGALRWVSSAEYVTRARKVVELEIAISRGQDKTLAGCRITCSETEFRIFREARAVRDVVCATDQLWDNRWRMEGPHAPGLEIRALGAEGLRACPDWRATGRPRASLLASPAIWRGADLISAPIAGYAGGWSAKLAKGRDEFAESLISH